MAIANAVDATQTGVQCLTSGGVWNGRTITAGTGISVTNGDGVSGNPTIAATGSTGGLGTVVIYDDFIGSTYATASGTGGVGNSNILINLNGASSVSNTTGDSSHPGQFTITTSTAVAWIGNPFFTLANGAVTVQWVAKIPTLSTGTNRFTVCIGLGDDMNVGPNAGLYFNYSDNLNSGNWQIINKGAGTTTGSTNVAVDTNWHTYKIAINAAATVVNFYIDGTEVNVSPQNTNIPTGAIGFLFGIARGLGTGGTLTGDMLSFIWNMTTPRSG